MQEPASASRRLLQALANSTSIPMNSSAEVHLQLNAHTASRVAYVGSNLATAVDNGLLQVKVLC